MKILTNKQLGYQKSREATPQDIATAQSVLAFFNENNGKFEGAYNSAFALSHCQVEQSDPIRFFVVARDFLDKPDKPEKDDNRTDESYFFESQVIYNPEILEALPVFLVEATNPNTGEKKNVARSNVFRPIDACMSFPHRKPKKVDRFLKIKVKYQVAVNGELVERTEAIEGLKAHIFQHEIDHHQGINIIYGDGERRVIPIAERYVGTSDEVLPDPEQGKEEEG